MTIDLRRLTAAMHEISDEKGPFTLFGLFMRVESLGRWDLLVSAPWLEEGKLRALGEFVEMLSRTFSQDEILSLSRIVTVNENDPVLAAILTAVSDAALPAELRNQVFHGVPIDEAHVLAARRCVA